MSDRVRELAEAVEALHVPADTETLAEVLVLADRLQAKIAAGAGQVDADGTFELDGAVSIASWLRDRGGMSVAQASGLARTAKRMHPLPVTASAWQDGTLSGGQVQAIVANTSERTVEVFAEHEIDLVPVLAPLNLRDTVTAMQTWRARAEALLDEDEPAEPDRSLHLSRSLNGRRELSGFFDGDGGALAETALRMASTRDVEGDPERTPAQRRADAFLDICQFFLDHQHQRPGGRHRPHLNVIVDADEFEQGGSGRLEDGTLLPRSSVERLLCDCALHRVVRNGEGSVLDYGRSTRTAPANLFNALVVRDKGCRHPSCDRPASWSDAHHVIPWEDGGETSISNLVLLCCDTTCSSTTLGGTTSSNPTAPTRSRSRTAAPAPATHPDHSSPPPDGAAARHARRRPKRWLSRRRRRR